ncbi:hypothetical protein [uncultured Mameliella sp.]|uniref:hypothetical protein n=1 Tax=uncultured Mameliella sp. TaxID=1447087 RepID=UPI002608EA9B|nr:hypothetical protein [uncultured Mameliella sp.]
MTRLAIALALAASLAVGIYALGRRDHARDIQQENDDATKAAIWAELGRRDCVAAGGLWDFAAGECAGPVSDPR